MPDDRAAPRFRLRPTLVPRRVDREDGAVDWVFDLVGPDSVPIPDPPRAKLTLDWPTPEPVPEPPPKACRVCGDLYGHWHEGPFCPRCEARTRAVGCLQPDVDYRTLFRLHDARTALCHLTDHLRALTTKRPRKRPARTTAR